MPSTPARLTVACAVLLTIFAAALAIKPTPTIVAVVILAVVYLLSRFPDGYSVGIVAVLLVLAPDATTLVTVSGFQVTARLGVSLIMALATLLACARGQLQPRFPAAPIWLVLSLVVTFASLQAHRANGVEQFMSFVLAPYIAAATIASQPLARAKFVRGMVFGTVALSLVAFVERFRGADFFASNFANQDYYVRAGGLRVTAGWSYPVALGAFMALMFFVAIGWARQQSVVWKLALPATILSVIILTQARAALLGVAAGFVVWVLAQRGAKDAIRGALGIGAASAGVLFLPFTAGFRSFVGQSFASGSAANANIAYRQLIYARADLAIDVHPLTGYGYGRSQNLSAPPLSNYFGGYTDLASLPLGLLIDIGYFGAFCFALVWVAGIVRVMRAEDRLIGKAGLLSGFAASAVTSIGVLGVSTVLWMVVFAGIASGAGPTAEEIVVDPQSAAEKRAHRLGLGSSSRVRVSL